MIRLLTITTPCSLWSCTASVCWGRSGAVVEELSNVEHYDAEGNVVPYTADEFDDGVKVELEQAAKEAFVEAEHDDGFTTEELAAYVADCRFDAWRDMRRADF